MVDKRGIKGLLMNLILPGLGTIFLENKNHGQLQLTIFLFPIVISIIFGAFLNNIIAKTAVIPVIFALIMLTSWVWALTSSIKLFKNNPNTLKETEKSEQNFTN